MHHHPTRPPSSGPAHVKCGGYASAGGDSPATLKGTRIHEHLEQVLTGQTVTSPVSADELPGVEWAHKYVKENFDMKTLKCEGTVKVFDESGNEITFGTNDLYDDKQIGDFKTGQVREYKAQMAYYAAGRMQQSGSTEIKIHEIYTEKRWANVYILSYSEAWQIIKQITYNQENNILKPNNYCSWCKHNSQCTALSEVAMNTLEKISPETELKNYDFTQLKTAEDKGKAYQICKILEDWISGVKRTVSEAVLKNGEEIPGVTVTSRSGGSSVSDIPAAFARMDLSQEEFLNSCSLSIPKLTKIYQKKFNLTGKEATQEVSNRLASLIKNKPDTKYIRRK